MLSYRQLDNLPTTVLERWGEVEAELIADMARRIEKTAQITETVKWQEQRLRAIGVTRSEMLQELAKTLSWTEKELADLFDAAAKVSVNDDDRVYKNAKIPVRAYDDNPQMQQITEAGLAVTNDDFRNFARSTVVQSVGLFTSVLDRAHLKLVSGGFSYQQVMRSAIKELSKEGLVAAQYPRRKEYLESAIRRTVIQGVNQTCGKLMERRMDETETYYVEVSAHPGARGGTGYLGHVNWQGEIYFWDRGNPWAQNPLGFPPFVSSTGYGEMLGLYGINCKHAASPYIPGISERNLSHQEVNEYASREVEYNGKKYSVYDASQIQRGLERSVRRWKRESIALEGAGLDATQERQRVALYQAELRHFIQETGLRRDYFRERVEGQ